VNAAVEAFEQQGVRKQASSVLLLDSIAVQSQQADGSLTAETCQQSQLRHVFS
jgi:hypothetical protein